MPNELSPGAVQGIRCGGLGCRVSYLLDLVPCILQSAVLYRGYRCVSLVRPAKSACV